METISNTKGQCNKQEADQLVVEQFERWVCIYV